MKLIVFEGLDGSGKTTLIQKIKEKLQAQNQEVMTLQGLGSSSIGPKIRKIFLTRKNLANQTRYLLSFANMIQTQEEILIPLLKTNTIILIDRWLGSNFAYRVYPYPNNTNYQFFNLLSKCFIQPAMTIYLKTTPEIGLHRKQNQPHHQIDVIESSPIAYFQKVAQGYEEFFKRNNLGIKLMLNATDFTNIEPQQKHIIEKIGAIINGYHH
ncbi:MAG: dTMP kinase [Candidatus Phytoplasma australasiaticum]|nr:dTMP kinase [Candidatus Phytoplasma australasiaticum]